MEQRHVISGGVNYGEIECIRLVDWNGDVSNMSIWCFNQIQQLPKEVFIPPVYKMPTPNEINYHLKTSFDKKEWNDADVTMIDDTIIDQGDSVKVQLKIDDVCVGYTSLKKTIAKPARFVAKDDDIRVAGYVHWEGDRHYLVSITNNDMRYMYRISPNNDTGLTARAIESLVSKFENHDKQIYCE
jgi:hypothetical protein